MLKLVLKSANDDKILKEIGTFETWEEVEKKRSEIFWETVKEYGLDAYDEAIEEKEQQEVEGGKEMKKVIMYLGWHYDFGHHYYWRAERTWPDWDPYYVEIPEDFELRESVSGEMLYYRGDDDKGYELTISKNSPEGRPVLVGGSKVELLTLKVLGPAEE